MLCKTIYSISGSRSHEIHTVPFVMHRRLTGEWHLLFLKLMGLIILIPKRLEFYCVCAPDLEGAINFIMNLSTCLFTTLTFWSSSSY